MAFAPDLYHGKVADNIADAERLGSALDANHEQAKAEIAEAARFLQERAASPTRRCGDRLLAGRLYALDLAAAEPERVHSVVVFYGTGGGDFSGSRAAYLGHFADADEFEPQSNVDGLESALRHAGRPVTFHRYAGTGHWFFEPGNQEGPGAYGGLRQVERQAELQLSGGGPDRRAAPRQRRTEAGHP